LTAYAASTDGCRYLRRFPFPLATICENLVAFDPHHAYRLNPAATLRPEPFGALAYHFGTRRLSFLKTRQLLTVVRLLESHDSAADALDAVGVPVQQRARYAAALAALADSEVIDAR
jgi:mycofactocin biosynthesis protein MftB